MFGFISYSIAAGVNIYFLMSSLFRIAQQELMYRFDPVLVAHVKQQAKEIEAHAYEKPKGKDKNVKAPPAKEPKPARNGPQGRKQGGNRSNAQKRAKKGR
jgi:YidC/Oxa1 family membrane protein insertase